MRIFVSSRHNEVAQERKTAIETIHSLGHTPVFIEAEPTVNWDTSAPTMAKLISASDYFVGLYYLSIGDKQSALGTATPIQYELSECKRQNKPYLLLFKNLSGNLKRDAEVRKLIDDLDCIRRSNPSPVAADSAFFDRPEDLSQIIVNRFRGFPPTLTAIKDTDCFVIRYTGPDRSGLIFEISEYLFRLHAIDLTYISQAARSRWSTVYLSCVVPGGIPDCGVFCDDMKKHVSSSLKKLDENITPSELDRMQLHIDPDEMRRDRFYIYAELRVINTPGELNAVSRVIKDDKFSIDEIIQRPAEGEHSNQCTLCLWLSHEGLRTGTLVDEKVRMIVHNLESRLLRLIGVRAMTTRLIDHMENVVGGYFVTDGCVSASRGTEVD